MKVMFFCLGNICRSPLAEALFTYKVQQRGLEAHFHIESSGTSSYHVGEAPDPGSQRVARERLGLDISDQCAQQLDPSHLADFDYLVAMDRSNRSRAQSMRGGDDANILLLRDFEPAADDRGGDVPDPWGGGQSQFERVYSIVDRCCDELLTHIVEREDLAEPSG